MKSWQILSSTTLFLAFLPLLTSRVEAASVVDPLSVTFLESIDSLTNDQVAQGNEGTISATSLDLNNSFLGNFTRSMNLEITTSDVPRLAVADIGFGPFVQPGVQQGSGLILENERGVTGKVTLEYSMLNNIDFTTGGATGVAVELITADKGSNIELVFGGQSVIFPFNSEITIPHVVAFPFSDFGSLVNFTSIPAFSLSLAGQETDADISMRILATYANNSPINTGIPESSVVVALLLVSGLVGVLIPRKD